jgi:ADP-heptose:LPS heptosyltransferase
MSSLPLQQISGRASYDAAARVSFVKMTARKWRLVRLFERVLRLALPFLPAPQSTAGTHAAPKRILVVEYWNLGDLAILVPFLRALRSAFPRAHISLLLKPGLVSFLDGQKLVDEFIPVRVPWAQHLDRWKKYNPFSRNWISLFRALASLRKSRFDLAFSGRMDIRDNLLLWLSGARRRIGYGFAGGEFLLTDSVFPDFARLHRADVWLHLLDNFKLATLGDEGSYELTKAEIASAEAFLKSLGISQESRVVGIHPAARIRSRRWGDERFAEVARDILETTDAHILWFTEPGEQSEPPRMDRCHEVKIAFRSFIGVLSFCDLLVCNDSGPMHIANLLGVPVVAVFGPQRPEWFGPRGPQDRVVIRPEMWCRPCFDYCMFGEPHCLRSITPAEVIRAVTEFAGAQQERELATPSLNSSRRSGMESIDDSRTRARTDCSAAPEISHAEMRFLS